MAKRFRLAGAAMAVAGALGCQEDIVAPGACPEYCPGASIEMVDSLLAGTIANDTSFLGYVTPRDAGVMHLVHDPAGTGLRSRGVVRFLPFPDRLAVGTGDTTTAPVVATDSFRIELSLVRRRADAPNMELAFHRLPADVDALVTFAALDAFFADSTRIGTEVLPDTFLAGTLREPFDSTAFPGFEADGGVATVGIALNAPVEAFADVGASESGAGLRLTRFTKIDSAGTLVTRTDEREADFDLYAGTGVPAAPAGDLMVGGAPSGRTFLDMNVPPGVLDSAQVVQATLILVPSGPAVGATGDTLIVAAHGIPADVGKKSPFTPIPQDSLPLRSVRVPVGSADTVRVDVTDVLRAWRANPDLPRVLMLRAAFEGNSFAEARFHAVGATVGPALRVTFIPPLRLGGPR